jgi:hypothetical protein
MACHANGSQKLTPHSPTLYGCCPPSPYWEVYLDDIVIWSNSVSKHTKHIHMVMEALVDAKLHLNPKKCTFFCLEIDFLGHHISACGIEPNSSKVEKIMNWPIPQNATDVCAFLGLIRYVATFLPKLADHTTVLTPLTTKDAGE